MVRVEALEAAYSRVLAGADSSRETAPLAVLRSVIAADAVHRLPQARRQIVARHSKARNPGRARPPPLPRARPAHLPRPRRPRARLPRTRVHRIQPPPAGPPKARRLPIRLPRIIRRRRPRHGTNSRTRIRPRPVSSMNPIPGLPSRLARLDRLPTTFSRRRNSGSVAWTPFLPKPRWFGLETFPHPPFPV